MTSNPNQTQQNRNKTAAALMFVAVLCFALIPLFVAWGGSQSPFIFNTALAIGEATGCVVFLMIAHHKLLLNKSVWKLVRLRVFSWMMLLWALAFGDLSFYVWSTQFIDVSIAAILFATWPILLVFLTSRLFKFEQRYQKVTWRSAFLFVIAFVGVVAVIASQAGGLRELFSGLWTDFALGIVLILASAVITSFAAFGFKWGVDLANELPNHHRLSNESMELFGVMAGTVILALCVSPITAGIGFARGEPIVSQTLIYGFVAGVVVVALPGILWRKANLITHSLNINVMVYITPVLSLGLLFAFSLVGDVNIMLLLFGAVLIIMANVLIYLEFDAPPQRQPVAAPDSVVDANALIAAGESDRVEFKSTLRTNLHTNRRDRAMESAVTKTLAAFLNSDGGALVIGVADDGAPVGIAVDGFATEDRMSLHLRNIVNRDMGPLAMAHIRLSYEDCEGVRIMVAHCERSERPVYVKEGNAEKFYIRTGPSTTELVTSAAVDYIRTRFGS